MVDSRQFLTDFTKDIIHDPMERQSIIAGWTKHLDARDQANRATVLYLADKFVEENPDERLSTSGWRALAEKAAGLTSVSA